MNALTLKQTRLSFGLTQKETAEAVDMPIRTYIRYETDENYGNRLKRKAAIGVLNDRYAITEDKGVLTRDFIASTIKKLLEKKYKDSVDLCILFGSYAKGYATDSSDVDLLVSTTLQGAHFAMLMVEVSEALHKRVDILRLGDIKQNETFLSEILKGGVRIYG